MRSRLGGGVKLLSVITSIHTNDYEFIKKNISSTSRLNKGVDYCHYLIDNSGEFDVGELNGAENVMLVPGVKIDESLPERCRGSYRHAAALNAFLQSFQPETRYVLILDPDFYIVRQNWIPDVVAHMQHNNLSFFGAPWHPKWYSKYRGFPCVHCIFVDSDQIDLKELDFSPDLIGKNK